MKRASAYLLILALLLSPLGAAASMGRGSLLTLGMVGGSSDYINPFVSPERDMMALTSLIYEGLVQINDDYAPQAALAERWESSTDGSTWTFYLREGVTFHDGTPLTAADAEASAKEILRLATAEGSATAAPMPPCAI